MWSLSGELHSLNRKVILISLFFGANKSKEDGTRVQDEQINKIPLIDVLTVFVEPW